MAKLSSQFKLISPGMTSDEATSGLVSVMKAYDIEVDNVLDGIMSKINIVGNKFALTNADIVAMLQDSVSAMREGNNTLDETIALETAAFEITQDRNVGNGFKTVALRLRGINEETQEADESLKTIKGDLYDLTGVSVMENADTYKSTYKILKEMSEVWDSLSDKTQAETLEMMFGKHRANIGAAALKNFKAAERAMTEMSDSAGNADAEMSVAMDSIAYKLNKLKETGTGIAQNLFERDDMKEILTLLTGLAETIEFLTGKIGLLGTLGMGLGTFFSVKNVGLFKTYSNELSGFTNKIGFSKRSFAEWGAQVSQAFKNGETKLRSFSGALKTAFIIPNNANLIKNELGNVVTRQNIDSYIPKLNDFQASVTLQSISDTEKAVKQGTTTWKQYSQTLSKGERYIVKWAKETEGQTRTINGLKEANESARNSIIAQNEAIRQSAISAKVASKAYKLLSAAGNILGTMGLIFVIDKIISGFNDLVNAAEIAKEKANGFMSSIKSFNSEMAENSSKISEINNRYEELSKGVGDLGQNLSLTSDEYKEYKNLVSQVSEIMPNLNVLYNAQGEKIKVLTDNMIDLNKQYALYKQQTAQKFLTKGDDDGNTVDNYLDNINRETTTYNQDMNSIFGFLKYTFTTMDISDNVLTPQGIKVFYTDLLKLNQEEMEKEFSTHRGPNVFLDMFSSSINRSRDFYMEAICNELNVDSSDIANMDTKEFNAFKEQLAAGLKEAEIQLEQHYTDLKFLFQQYAITANGENANWNNLTESEQNNLNNFFNSLSSYAINALDLKDKDGNFAKTKIAAFVNNIISAIDNESTGVSEALNKLFTLNPDSIPYQEYEKQAKEAIKTIIKSLNLSDEGKEKIKFPFQQQFGLSSNFKSDSLIYSDSLIDKVKYKFNSLNKIKRLDTENAEFPPELEKIIENYKKNFEIINQYIENIEFPPEVKKIIEDYKKKFEKNGEWIENAEFSPELEKIIENYKKNFGEVDEWIETLNKKDLEILYNIEAKDNWTLADFKKALENAKKEAEKPIKPLSFNESLKELDNFTDGFSKLDKIYADVYDKESFDFGSLISKDFIETFGKYENEYEKLVNVISKSPDDINACQSAFDNLVNAWFNGEQIFKNLNEETKNATIAYLEQNGVVNAAEIVTQRLAAATEEEALKSQFAAENSYDLADASFETAKNFLDKASACDTAKLEMAKLVAANAEFNNTGLSVQDKINALGDLAEAANQAAFSVQLATKTKNIESSFDYAVAKFKDRRDGNTEATDSLMKSVYDEALADFQKLTSNDLKPPKYTGGSSTRAARDKAGKKGSGGGSKKEHETNDEYYNYYQARADDLKNGAEELEKEIEEIGAKIESAYKKGDTILAESLKKDLSDKQREYKDYLAKNAKTIRDMANSEILPIVYKIAPEFAGKTIDEFTDTEKLKVKERLDNEILARKNKIIDLENAGKSSDGSAKVSDSEVKSAERQLKILEELYTTLENIYDLAGNSAGQGEWAKKFRETIDNEIDKIKDDLDKNIDEREFKLSLFEDMGNDGGQLSVYRKMLQDYHSAAEEYRAMGVEEDSEAIKETQKGYRDAAKNIFELLNDTFDKFMDKRNDLSDNIEFKIDNLGDKEYGRHISLLEDEIALRKDNIAYIVKERNRLLEAYKNSTIAADEYEKRQRSLNDLEKEQVKSLKEYYETKRDIIMSQIDGQIDNITEATEKQTKAIDKQIDSLEKENDELNKLKDLYDKAYKAVQKIVDDETDALDKLKEQEEEYWNAKLDALEKMNEETKRGIELTEKKQAVEKAGQKTALVYHEDKGWTYEANPNELSEAQRDLDQWLIDDQFNQAKKSIEEQKEAVLKSIDEQIEGWNNYLELWGDAADAFEEEANDAAAKAVIGLNYSSQVLAQNTGIVSKYEKEYTDILRKIGDETSGGIAKQINDLEKQREAIEENSDAVTEALENEKKVWEELFSQGMIENVDAFVSHLEEKLNLVIGSVQGARELIQAFSNDMRDFVPHASELIPYNDEDIITIKQMYQNSGQWAKSNSQKSKDQLFARNEELSKQLSFSVRFDSHTGAWLDDNGNNIYGRLSENNDTAQRNTEAETENTYTIEGNTKASENNTKFLKSSVSQNKKLTSVIEKTTDTIEDLTDSVDSLSKNSGSLDRENNTENSNGNNSQTGSSLPSSSTGSPYTYSAELGGADIDTAKKWFEDKHKTYPGSKITVVGGGVSSLSSELISELGLKNGDLAVVGKRLYYITSNGYNKITDSLVNKYAKGCEYIPYSQTAVVDEEGDGTELLVHKDMKGRPKYLERGSEVVSAGHTRSLTSLLEDIGNSNVINALRDISGQYNPIKRIADSFTKAPDYIMGNNQNTSTVNNNYIDKVVLEQVNNVDDMFRGLTNMAMQRAHKRV